MLVFIDESGDHNLDILRSDNLYNVFVLAAICFTNEMEYENFDSKFRQLKFNFFDTDNIIIHTGEIKRPIKSKNPLNLKFHDHEFRVNFYSAINELIRETDFVIVPRIINKPKLLDIYKDLAGDPYLISFEYILDQFLSLEINTKARVYVEKRGRVEDMSLELLYSRFIKLGTKASKSITIKSRIDNLNLIGKEENYSGSQLADLVVSPIGRHFIGKSAKIGHEVLYSTIREKFHRNDISIFP